MSITIKTRKGNYYVARLNLAILPILILVAGGILAGIIFGFQTYYKKIYNDVHQAIIEKQPSVTLPKNKTAENALLNCAYSTPEIFTVDRISYYDKNKNRTYSFTYNSYAKDYEKNLVRLNGFLDEMTATCPEFRSDEEKVKWIHDQIAERFEYDYTYTNYSALSMFDKGKGVCNAYTSLFTALAQKLGLQYGVAVSDNMNHTWNIVKVGKTWYNVDVTWDDRSDGYNYEYYLKTNEEFLNLDHHDWIDTSKNYTYYDGLKLKLFKIGGIALGISVFLTFAPLLFNYLFR